MTREQFNAQVDNIARVMGWAVSDKRGFPDPRAVWVEFEVRESIVDEPVYVPLTKQHFDLLQTMAE